MEPHVEYLPDDRVDDKLDAEIRNLLTTCFTKPQDWVFKERRYFIEPYPHRWVIRNARGLMVAHVGVHDKTVESGSETFRIGGICEVCVHPDYRGGGFVKLMLAAVHDRLFHDGCDFAVLFGDPLVYASSGYREVANLFYGPDRKQETAMVRELANKRWPAGEVYLPGSVF